MRWPPPFPWPPPLTPTPLCAGHVSDVAAPLADPISAPHRAPLPARPLPLCAQAGAQEGQRAHPVPRFTRTAASHSACTPPPSLCGSRGAGGTARPPSPLRRGPPRRYPPVQHPPSRPPPAQHPPRRHTRRRNSRVDTRRNTHRVNTRAIAIPTVSTPTGATSAANGELRVTGGGRAMAWRQWTAMGGRG